MGDQGEQEVYMPDEDEALDDVSHEQQPRKPARFMTRQNLTPVGPETGSHSPDQLASRLTLLWILG